MTINLDEMLKIGSSDSKRVYIGIEYECPNGQRFFLQKDLVAQHLPHAFKNGQLVMPVLLGSEIPLFLTSPASKKSNKLGDGKSLGQLMRIFIATPNCPFQFLLNPKVTWKRLGTEDKITFEVPQQQVVLPCGSLVVLRLPYLFNKKDLVLSHASLPTHIAYLNPFFIHLRSTRRRNKVS